MYQQLQYFFSPNVIKIYSCIYTSLSCLYVVMLYPLGLTIFENRIQPLSLQSGFEQRQNSLAGSISWLATKQN